MVFYEKHIRKVCSRGTPMTIHLPDNYRGKDVDQAYQAYLKKPIESNPSPAIITPSTIDNPSHYILLPSDVYCPRDLLIAKQRSHDNETWSQCQELLPKESHFMLPVRQFVDFLNLLQTDNAYDGSGAKLSRQERTDLFKDITEQRAPYRAEWLDAQYTKQGKIWQVTYTKVQPNGSLTKVTEPLEACLMENKTPGISLEDWLQRATRQGLPSPNVKSGSLSYWSPTNNGVSRFWAVSVRVYLYCVGDPRFSSAGLGTRAARVK